MKLLKQRRNLNSSMKASTNGTLKAQIHRLLGYGKENAITGKRLAKILGFRQDRIIRQAIRELIADRVPVASSVNPPYGYYIVNNPDEAKEYMRVLRSRLISDAYRRRDFKRASRTILNPHQMILI